MNAYMKVIRTVVYNKTLFWFVSSSAHCGSNTAIDNGNDTSFLGEVWTFLEYTIRKANIHDYSDGI